MSARRKILCLGVFTLIILTMLTLASPFVSLATPRVLDPTLTQTPMSVVDGQGEVHTLTLTELSKVGFTQNGVEYIFRGNYSWEDLPHVLNLIRTGQENGVRAKVGFCTSLNIDWTCNPIKTFALYIPKGDGQKFWDAQAQK